MREWPSGYSVWNEDASAADGSGYTLLASYTRDPTREMLDDLFDAANPFDPDALDAPQEPSGAAVVFNEVSGFFKGLSRL